MSPRPSRNEKGCIISLGGSGKHLDAMYDFHAERSIELAKLFCRIVDEAPRNTGRREEYR